MTNTQADAGLSAVKSVLRQNRHWNAPHWMWLAIVIATGYVAVAYGLDAMRKSELPVHVFVLASLIVWITVLGTCAHLGSHERTSVTTMAHAVIAIIFIVSGMMLTSLRAANLHAIATSILALGLACLVINITTDGRVLGRFRSR